MKLVSCDNCGIVYDLDKVTIPEVWVDEDNSRWEEPEFQYWDGEKFIPQFKCVGCGELVDTED